MPLDNECVMLALSLVQEIERLLQDGTLSQRKIAVRLGVGRGTVAAIASGRRGIYGREADDDLDPLVHHLPPERCPECGFFVYMPCMVCRAREHRHWQKVWQTCGSDGRSVTDHPRRLKLRRRRRTKSQRPSRARVA
jgi:hypothetical protein